MSTGFPAPVRNIITARASGICERCCIGDGEQAHHRRPRGMGGSKDPITNTAANGVLLCEPCHRFVESNRALALDQGWLVRQSRDPREVPVFYRGSHWVTLTTTGGIVNVDHSNAAPGAG